MGVGVARPTSHAPSRAAPPRKSRGPWAAAGDGARSLTRARPRGMVGLRRALSGLQLVSKETCGGRGGAPMWSCSTGARASATDRRYHGEGTPSRRGPMLTPGRTSASPIPGPRCVRFPPADPHPGPEPPWRSPSAAVPPRNLVTKARNRLPAHLQEGHAPSGRELRPLHLGNVG
jgi:hypothetical protein